MQTNLFVKRTRQAEPLLLLLVSSLCSGQTTCHNKIPHTSQSDHIWSYLGSENTHPSPLHTRVQANMAFAAENRMLTAPNSKLTKVDLAVCDQLQHLSKTY